MKRRPEFIAHPSAELFLEQINGLIAAGESNASIRLEACQPIVLVVGAPRSGTTILMQWLNEVGIAVPSNIAARFPLNPYFAGMLQRLLSDPNLNYRDELTIAAADEKFRSDYGKTRGPLAPHEFSFFFRRFFPVTVGEVLSPQQLEQCDTAGFLRGISLFGAAIGAAVAVKALLIQYHLSLFADASNVLALHVQRDAADNVCSLLRHRKRVAGDSLEWISVRPPEYEWLRHLSPVEQVAGQVYFTNRAIEAQLSHFPRERAITLNHESFCMDPAALHAILQERFAAIGAEPPPPYRGPKSFEPTRYDREAESYRSASAALERIADLAQSKS